MDGVKSVRQTLAVFSLLPNPTLLPFKDDRKVYRGEILSLQVTYILDRVYKRGLLTYYGTVLFDTAQWRHRPSWLLGGICSF